MRQGEAGNVMCHRDHHRYKEAQKGNPDTERHHSCIHSVQKITVIIYIPNYTINELNPKLNPIFRLPQEGAHILSRAGDARAASASRRGLRKRRARSGKLNAGPFFFTEQKPPPPPQQDINNSSRLTAETPHKYT